MFRGCNLILFCYLLVFLLDAQFAIAELDCGRRACTPECEGKATDPGHENCPFICLHCSTTSCNRIGIWTEDLEAGKECIFRGTITQSSDQSAAVPSLTIHGSLGVVCTGSHPFVGRTATVPFINGCETEHFEARCHHSNSTTKRVSFEANDSSILVVEKCCCSIGDQACLSACNNNNSGSPVVLVPSN